jgi:hypothetical protein
MNNYFDSQMFAVCPKSSSLIDSVYFYDLDSAKDDALDWSVELNGDSVIVYQVPQSKMFDDFKALYEINA